MQLGYRTSLDAAEAYRREVRQFPYTSLDRMINRSNDARQVPGADDESLHFTIRLTPNESYPQGLPKSVAHHIGARLLTLKDMGLAETMDGNSPGVSGAISKAFYEPCSVPTTGRRCSPPMPPPL